jgi:hypothetical protein
VAAALAAMVGEGLVEIDPDHPARARLPTA